MLAQQWWSYQFLALTVPFGLLAGGTLTRLLNSKARRAFAATLILVPLVASHWSYLRTIVDLGPNQTAG